MPATPRTHQPALPRGDHLAAIPRRSLDAPGYLLWPDGSRILLEAGDGALAELFGGLLLDSDGGALVLDAAAFLAEGGDAGMVPRTASLPSLARPGHAPSLPRH